MLSLEEFHKKRAEKYKIINKGLPNNIACPKCGQELCDVKTKEFLLSYPPKISVRCSSCDFVGYRIA